MTRVSLLRLRYFSEHRECAWVLKCNLGNKIDWMFEDTRLIGDRIANVSVGTGAEI